MSVIRNALTGYPKLAPNPPPLPKTVIWRIAGGRTFEFHLHPLNTPYRPVSGVYIFCRQALPNQWEALYIGEADDLDARVGTKLHCHHKWPSVVLKGATHVCTLVVGGTRAERLALETALRHFYRPVLNDQ